MTVYLCPACHRGIDMGDEGGPTYCPYCQWEEEPDEPDDIDYDDGRYDDDPSPYDGTLSDA